MPNTTTFDPRDLRAANALMLTRAALLAAWSVIERQGGAYADALPTAKRQYQETMNLMAEDDTDDQETDTERGTIFDVCDDADDYEAGECYGDEDRGHEEALYGDSLTTAAVADC